MALDPATFKDIISAWIRRVEEDGQDWDRCEAMYRCENWQTKSTDIPVGDYDLVTESGAVYAYVDSMIASVVPPNPQVTCKPRRSALKPAATYREALINDCLKRTGAAQCLWKLATHASVYPRGILKVVWNIDRHRPEFHVIDVRNFFFDATATKWEDVRYVIEATVMTKAEFRARVVDKRKREDKGKLYDADVAKRARAGGFPTWLKSKKTGFADVPDRVREVFQWVVVFEVHDFTTPRGTYYHFLQDVKEPLFKGDLPYVFVRNPFYMLTFNDSLRDIGGNADAQIVSGPVRRLDEVLTLELRHAQASIPVTVVNSGNVDNPQETKQQLRSATNPGDMVDLKAKNGMSIGDCIGQTPVAQILPAFPGIQKKLIDEIMFRLGMPQYSRGQGGTSELATDLALIDAERRTRQGRRSSLVNTVIVFMAKSIIGLYEEFMTADDMLPVRLGGSKFMEIARQHLQARDPAVAEQILASGQVVEEPLDIDYDVVPYSPVENSKVAQLKKLSEFAKLLFSSVTPPEVQRAALQMILDLLELGIELPEQLPQQAALPPQLPGGQPGNIQTPTDAALKGGELPQGVSPPPVATGAIGAMAGGAGHPTPGLAK